MRFRLLDPLRGMAALWVFFFHLHFSDAFRQAFPPLYHLFKQGHFGVPMFFVISGYCLAASARATMTRQGTVKSFLHRRFKRIYPPFWCSVLVVVAVPFVIEFLSALRTGHYEWPSANAINYGFLRFGLAEWFRVLTLLQVFSPMPDARVLSYKFTAVNAVYWTLAIEVQFYLVVAVALSFQKYFYRILAFTTVVSLLSWAWRSIHTTGIFLPYWPMFAVGILLFWVIEKGIYPAHVGSPGQRRWCLGVIAVMVLTMAGLFLLRVPVNHWAFAVFFGTLLWFAKGLDGWFDRSSPTGNWLQRKGTALTLVFGSMSYSLYLLHGRLQFLVAQLSRQVVPVNTIASDVSVITGTCILCYVFYRYCEAPFLSSPVRLPSQRREIPSR